MSPSALTDGGMPGSAGSHLSTMSSFSAIGSDYRFGNAYDLHDEGLNSDDEFGTGTYGIGSGSSSSSEVAEVVERR